jgi:DNA-binding SARP family transcriptional activator
MVITSRTFLGSDQFRLVTLGDAALYASTSKGREERILEVGKPLAVLIYLACVPNREASRDELIELLWSHVDRERAQNALRQTLWLLRTQLGDQIVSTTRDRVSLGVPLRVDRDSFLAAAATGELDAVISGYGGDFIPSFAAPGGVCFERWADLERSTLRRVFVRSAHEVVRRRLAQGQAREALPIARRARDFERSNQATWRQIFDCLMAIGDFLGATLEADALEQFLKTDETESETATVAALRAARSGPASSTQLRSDSLSAALVAELVGREREFALVMQAWHEASNGRGSHVHIVAPAGFGKTRFLLDVHGRLRGTRGRGVYVRAEFGTRDIAYSFVSDVAGRLGQLRGAAGVSPASAKALVALNPVLSSIFHAEPDPASGDEALRCRALAFRELLSAVADERPLALLLDDLQWADLLSFRVLAAALHPLDTSRVLVVSSRRSTADDTNVPHDAATVAFDALNIDAVSALISSLGSLPNDEWAESLPAALCGATGGSPLLILETLQLLIERGALELADGKWASRNVDALSESLAAESALRRRVANLDSAEASVLLTLAVAGVPLNQEVVVSAIEADGDSIPAAVVRLEHRGLLLRREGALSPAHDEHARAVIEAASPSAVRQAAGSLGKVLFSRAGENEHDVRIAGLLLARGGDQFRESVNAAFRQFVGARREMGDRRSGHLLARDLLGASATPDGERSLSRSLPWSLRIRLARHTQAMIAIGTVAFLLVASVATLVALSRPAPPPPDGVLIAYWNDRHANTTDVVEVRLDERSWGATSSIDVDVTRQPTWKVATRQLYSSSLRPDGRGWIGWQAVSDSGVLDIFEYPLHGFPRRVTFNVHDDLQPSFAPDGSRFAFVTSRWNPTGQYDVAIFDTLSRTVRQLTVGEDIDMAPLWSPDGSRIAFTRHHWKGGHSVCVIDVAGDQLKCFSPKPGQLREVNSWIDSHHVAFSAALDDSTSLSVIDVDNGQQRVVEASGSAAWPSPDGRWTLAQVTRPGYRPDSWIVYPTDRPNEFKRLNVVGSDPTAVSFSWSPASPRPPYIDSLRIEMGPGYPTVGVPYQLRVSGLDRAGRPVPVSAIRWRTIDSSFATIDSMGKLFSHRTGAVSIQVSAGGWRTANVRIPIHVNEDSLLFEETWAHGLSPTWVPYGDPRPVTKRDSRWVFGFSNNGDDSFFSGAYTAREFEIRNGLWLETEVSIPLTPTGQQSQNIQLMAPDDSVRWQRWDRTTGDHPDGFRCTTHLPAGFGAHYGDSIVMGGRTSSRMARAPASLRFGSPVAVIIQIFPDGRCGYAIDGKPLWIGKVEFPVQRARINLDGRSVGTSVMVGPIRLFAGVSQRLDWANLDLARDAPNVSTRR